jgi:predicted transcriptional regulator
MIRNPAGKGTVGKQKSVKLTKFELEVMEELWRLGQASVREVQEGLPEKRRPAYTTVQTIVHRLEDKGVVRRAKKIGNAFVFEAVVTRAAAHRRLITELLDMLGGSARPLLAHLLEMGELSLEDLKELEQIVQQDPDGPLSKDVKPQGRGRHK